MHPCHARVNLQVLDLGCNAVLAYQQDFDMEGDSGIVARAYGTACVIQRREQQQLADKTTEFCLSRQVLYWLCEQAAHRTDIERLNSNSPDRLSVPTLILLYFLIYLYLIFFLYFVFLYFYILYSIYIFPIFHHDCQGWF